MSKANYGSSLQPFAQVQRKLTSSALRLFVRRRAKVRNRYAGCPSPVPGMAVPETDCLYLSSAES